MSEPTKVMDEVSDFAAIVKDLETNQGLAIMNAGGLLDRYPIFNAPVQKRSKVLRYGLVERVNPGFTRFRLTHKGLRLRSWMREKVMSQ